MFMYLGLISLVYFYVKESHQPFFRAIAISPRFSLYDLKPLVKLKGRHLTTAPILNILLHLLSLPQSNSVISFMWGLSIKFLFIILRHYFDDLTFLLSIINCEDE